MLVATPLTNMRYMNDIPYEVTATYLHVFTNQADTEITDLSVYEVIPHYVKGYLHTM